MYIITVIIQLFAIKEHLKKIRSYLRYENLILFLWFVFFFSLLYVDDLYLIFIGLTITIVLTAILYNQIRKSQKPLPRLRDTEIKPNFEELTDSSNRLEKNYRIFKFKVHSTLLTSDFGKEVETSSEYKLRIVLIFSYIFGLFVFIKFFSNENEFFRGLGIFLTTFGVMIFLGSALAYLKSVKALSDFLTRRHLRQFIGKNLNQITNSIAFIESYQCLANQQREKVPEEIQKKLKDLHSDLTELKDSIKNPRIPRIPLATSIVALLGLTLPYVKPIYEAYLNFEVGNLQALLPYVAIFGYIALIFLILFITIPQARENNLLRGFNLQKSEEDFTQAIDDLIKSLLGKDISEIVLNSLLYSS